MVARVWVERKREREKNVERETEERKKIAKIRRENRFYLILNLAF